MSFRPSNRRCICGGFFVTWLAVAGIVRAAEGSTSPGRAIEISDPRNSTLITNVNQLGSATPAELDLEVGFLTPKALTQPQTSLSGAMSLPPPSRGIIIPGKRAKELQDQRRNWAFASPEEAMRDMALREILNLPDYEAEGNNPRSSPSVGRYYEQMIRGQTGVLRQDYDWPGSRRTAEDRNRSVQPADTVSLLSGANQPEHSLRNLLNPDGDGRPSLPDSGPGSLLEAFGLRDDSVSHEPALETLRAREAQETQLKRFQSLLDKTYEADPLVPTRPAAPANPWLNTSSATSPGLNLYNPLAAPPGTALNLAPPLPPSAPTAPTASSLTPASFLPQPQQVNSQLLRKPDITVPRRAF